jgi:tetratricopeptide (TPR) repeat protein
VAELLARLETTNKDLEADQQDFALAQTLDGIRLESLDKPGEKSLRAAVAPLYAKAFLQRKLDPTTGSPEELAQQIMQTPLRYVLVAALDNWALSLTSVDAEPVQAQLLAVAQRIDPDPWRNQVRNVKNWQDKTKLEALAAKAELAEQTPQLILLLAWRLNQLQGKALPLLRLALLHHPNDFWLHFDMGVLALDPAEQVSAYKAALAVRPQSVIVYSNLADALRLQGHLSEAVACCEKALVLNPKFSAAHNNIGTVRFAQKDLDSAIVSFRLAIQFDPNSVLAHYNLALALQAKGDLAGAIESFKSSAALAPKYAKPHFGLGLVLYSQKDYAGAISSFQKAVALDPDYMKAHNNLGAALFKQNDLAGAIVAYRKVVELQPDFAAAYCNLGMALQAKGKFAEALAAFQQGHQLGSKQPGWTYPSAQKIADCQQLLQLDEKLVSILDGKTRPRDAVERMGLVKLCIFRKCFVAAVTFFEDAAVADKSLAKGLNRYNAACAAAMAGTCVGADTDQLTVKDKAIFRQKALDWLRAELANLQEKLHADPKTAADTRDVLHYWQTDGNLTGVRQPEALSNLQEPERVGWQQFWADVKKSLSQFEK